MIYKMAASNPLGNTFAIQMSDVKDYNTSFTEGFLEDVRDVLSSGRYILGDQVQTFEKALASYVGTTHAIGVGSGTTALELAFRALELKSTDEIIIPANTYIASAFGALASGAKLVPVDCTLDGTLSLPEVCKAYTPNTRAVLVVHLYGDSCNMEELATFCKEKQIYLIEDCAQCLGSSYKGIKLGAWGTMSCHSFYPSKNLGAIGDAGAILTNDDALAHRCKLLRNLGVSRKYIHDIKATNGRMDTLQAAFLLRKLPDMDRVIEQKRVVANAYIQALGNLHIRSFDSNVYHSYHIFAVNVGSRRDEIMKGLAQAGIETLIHYPYPFYKTQAFEELNYLTFPNTELLATSMISLPMFATLSETQIAHITSTLTALYTLV